MQPQVIGRRVEVRVDLEWVIVTCAGQQVARHRRSWARHRTITAVEHGRARAGLRHAARKAAAARSADVEVEVRDPSVYDHAVGVA